MFVVLIFNIKGVQNCRENKRGVRICISAGEGHMWLQPLGCRDFLFMNMGLRVTERTLRINANERYRYPDMCAFAEIGFHADSENHQKPKQLLFGA